MLEEARHLVKQNAFVYGILVTKDDTSAMRSYSVLCEASLIEKLLLVDFENVKQLNLSRLGDITNIIAFLPESD